MTDPEKPRFWLSAQGRDDLERAQRNGLPAVLRGIWTAGWLLLDQAHMARPEHLAEEAVRPCEQGRDFLGFFLPGDQDLPEPRGAWGELVVARETLEGRAYHWLGGGVGEMPVILIPETGDDDR